MINKTVKPEDAGYVAKLKPEIVTKKTIEPGTSPTTRQNIMENNCSFTGQGHSWSNCLLPGPPLGTAFLGVSLRFRPYKAGQVYLYYTFPTHS